MATRTTKSRNGASKSYGQYCGVARALDVLGERWTLLVARELLMGPKRYTDLRDGLPGIATDLLTARLRTLQGAGLVRRRQLPRPAPATVYELTESGRRLAPALFALGQVGLSMLGPPEAGQELRPELIALSLRLSFRPSKLADLHESYQLEIDEEPFAITISRGKVDTAPGTIPSPAMTLATASGTLVAMLRRDVPPSDALADGRAQLDGDAPVLERFIDAFAYPTDGHGESTARIPAREPDT